MDKYILILNFFIYKIRLCDLKSTLCFGTGKWPINSTITRWFLFNSWKMNLRRRFWTVFLGLQRESSELQTEPLTQYTAMSVCMPATGHSTRHEAWPGLRQEPSALCPQGQLCGSLLHLREASSSKLAFNSFLASPSLWRPAFRRPHPSFYDTAWT